MTLLSLQGWNLKSPFNVSHHHNLSQIGKIFTASKSYLLIRSSVVAAKSCYCYCKLKLNFFFNCSECSFVNIVELDVKIFEDVYKFLTLRGSYWNLVVVSRGKENCWEKQRGSLSRTTCREKQMGDVCAQQDYGYEGVWEELCLYVGMHVTSFLYSSPCLMFSAL